MQGTCVRNPALLLSLLRAGRVRLLLPAVLVLSTVAVRLIEICF